MATIWITGGKGFIGQHLALHLAGDGHQVHGLGHHERPRHDDREPYASWLTGEIDAAALDQLVARSGAPDIVYHLAGGSSVGASFQHPHDDFARTVTTTARLLEWLRLRAAGTKLVAVSSAAVYGAAHSGAIAESASLAPYSPYGVHKAMMESVCGSYGVSFGLQVAVVRLFSVYGPGLRKQLIWDLCCKLENSVRGGHPVMLGGTGLEVRDWLHVSDAVKLLWLARTECRTECPVVNGGNGIGTTVKDVADCVGRAWGVTPDLSFTGVVRHGDPQSLIADTAVACRMGFRPLIGLEAGVDETVAWYKNARSAQSTV